MQFSKKNLGNGLRLITVPMKDNPTVTVLVMVEAGSKYETKELSGISHFLEHLCFKGTEKRPTSFDIAKTLDAIGAHYNAFTSQEFTGYYAKAQAKHFDRVLDVVSDIYLGSRFDETEIEKEKGVIVEEISMYEDSPRRHIHDLFVALLYGDQPAGWNIAGNRDSVRSFKKEDFESYRKNHYVSGATTVVVAGAVDEEYAMKEVERYFSGMHEGQKHDKTKIVEKQDAPAMVYKERKIDQAHLVLGVRTYDAFSTLTPAVNVLASLLGGGMSSRLFQKLRSELGVAYSVGAYNDTATDHGYLAVSAGIDRNRVEEVIKVILAEFSRLKTELVPEEELIRIKDHLTGSLSLELESSDSLAHFYGLQEILRKPLLLPEDMAKEIQAVTAEEIQKVAREIFVEKHLNLALIGDLGESERFRALLTLK